MAETSAPASAPADSSPAAETAPAPTEPAKEGTPGAIRGADGKFTSPPKAEAPKVAPQRVKLKVDGVDEEVDLDEAVRRATKVTAADKRFREAEGERKAAAAERAAAEAENGKLKALFSAMKDDPAKFARDLSAVASQRGVDPVKLAEAILRPLIDAELEKTLSPEEQRSKAMERELAQYRAQEAQRTAQARAAEEAKANAEIKSQIEKHRDAISSDIHAALKLTTLPQTHATALQVLDLMQELHGQGVSATPEQIAKELEAIEDAKAMERQARTKSTKLVHPELLKAALEEEKKRASEELRTQNPMAVARPVVGPGRATSQAPKAKGPSSAAIIRDLMMGHGITNK